MTEHPKEKRKSKRNKRTLLTFVGSHDPYQGVSESSGEGPVLSLMARERFDLLHIFYNNPEYLRRAVAVREVVQKRHPDISTSLEEISVADPTDYESLYEHMHHRSLAIIEKHDTDSEYFVALASGTPQMQTCWLLLVLGGVLPARLLQMTPPHKQKTGKSAVKEIRLSLDRFPKIVSPTKLKRELSIAAHRVEVLSREREAIARELAPGLIGISKKFRDVVAAAKRFADYEVPVLITGETGTGKEEIAKLLHFSSGRKEHPFLPINCASLPDTIFESELFGYHKGAFTGADKTKPGLLEVAGSGTVFLDEIGELSLTVQAKLLRVLEDGHYRPLGGTKEQKSKARIIAATNRDLYVMVEKGAFREDLLFRINTAEIHVPALRERPEDIGVLAQTFLEEFCRRYNKTIQFSPEALDYLTTLPWEGNVRLLRHAVERAVISTDANVVRTEDFVITRRETSPAKVFPLVTLGDAPLDLAKIIQEWEKGMIEQAIRRFQGNRSAAARHLGYEEATFRKKARKYFGLRSK